MTEEKTFSAKQVATRIGTEAKILRKFFRDPKSSYNPVGQGGRYDFPESEIPKIKAAFDDWNSGRTTRTRVTAKKVPNQRQSTEATERAPRRRRPNPEASPLDGDDLITRCRESIGERAKRRGLIPNQQGRLVKKEPEPQTILSNKEILEMGDKANEEFEEPSKEELDELMLAEEELLAELDEDELEEL